ncbi:Ig-like domain repeat protein [Nocardioides sp. J2M5]|uniref:Ig-like domain-containing protein n=1 Tax=Nocardioides palaemonis TaxID=2829810 RepID=UPI001BA765A8|nr:Ig-like domain-containing protein [Nocardioides palaemonis]MBS2939742.1 Ig-like domain repeat protein [Nocardioides palaemonis]
MSQPSRPWARLARAAATVLSATAVSAAGAVALVPSAASAAAPGAVVDLPGCTDNSLTGAYYDGASASLPAPVKVGTGTIDTVNVYNMGYLYGYDANGSGGGQLELYPLHLNNNSSGGNSGVTYGQTTWNGRPAFCQQMTDYRGPAMTGSSSAQALIVDRSDIAAGDFDVVYNYDRVQVDGRWAWSGVYLYSYYSSYYENWIAPGSGSDGALEDANQATGLIHSSRESSVLGRYVFRIRNGRLASTPDATITGKPAALGASSAVSFTYATSDAETFDRFECRVTAVGSDPADFATCADAGSDYDLADGDYRFEVRAVDTLGGVGDPTSYEFTVDTTKPVVTLTDEPSARSTDTTPTFAWTVGEATGSVECRVDTRPLPEERAAWEPCSSGDALAGLGDGDYRFEVRATDRAGNQGDATSSDFSIDTSGPAVSWTTTPDALTIVATPTFAWSTEDADVASYSCRLSRPVGEPAPWESCDPTDGPLTRLGDGDWRYEVKAVDDLGNEGARASYDFTVDTAAPGVAITGHPSARGNVTSPVFDFSSDAEDLDRFECRVTADGSEPADWHACSTGDELDGLTDGDWRFEVRAVDLAGNAGEAASFDFAVDTAAAGVTVTSRPRAIGNDATPSFAYVVDPSADLDHFECVVVPEGAQSASPERCDAAGFTSAALEDGSYVFSVVAVDTAGNTSDPATVRFTVDTVAPSTTVTQAPADVIATGSATFGWSSDESPTTTECRLSPAGQTAAWQSCAATSRTFGSLGDGSYTFEVRSTDAAGNTGAPARATTRVNLGQPTITAEISSATPISAFGWYRDAVTITYTCAGNGSPLVGACPAPRQVPRAQQGKVVFRASIATADGDTASVSTTLLIDKGKPQARIKGFSGKRVYTSVPKPTCRASDPRSGLDDCTVSVRKVTRKDGTTYVVVKATATDKAGNVRVVRKQAPLRAA